MKKNFVKDLVAGMAIDHDIFCAKIAGEEKDGKIPVAFSDKTGSVRGNVPKELRGSWEDGGCVEISAVILIANGMPYVVVKELSAMADFKPAEMYAGLPEEKISEYIADIKVLIQKIGHPGYRALAEACLTDQALRRLSEVPCTLNWYGCYQGAALAATDQVTRMAAQAMTGYVRHGNGLSTTNPAWSLLLTASLLHAYGRTIYFDAADPFKRSVLGVALGYFSTLYKAIQDVIRDKREQIPLTDQEEANLFNVLACSVSRRTDVHSISKDASILRHILQMYAECDAFDWDTANHGIEDGEAYHYSRVLNHYVMEVKSDEA